MIRMQGLLALACGLMTLSLGCGGNGPATPPDKSELEAYVEEFGDTSTPTTEETVDVPLG